MNGRIQCPNCNRRNTEITSTDRWTNHKKVNCRDCDHDWKHHTGEECPTCGSNNTHKHVHRAEPHVDVYITCDDCGRDKRH